MIGPNPERNRSVSILPTFYWQEFSPRSHLTARKAGGCRLAVCPGERGHGFDG